MSQRAFSVALAGLFLLSCSGSEFASSDKWSGPDANAPNGGTQGGAMLDAGAPTKPGKGGAGGQKPGAGGQEPGTGGESSGRAGSGGETGGGGQNSGGTGEGGQGGESAGGAAMGHGGHSAGGQASGGGAGQGSGGAPNPDKECPLEQPLEGAPCVGPLDCSYGGDPRVQCRARFECSDKRWVAAAGVEPNCGKVLSCSESPFPAVIGWRCQPKGVACFSDNFNFSCGCVPCHKADADDCPAETVWDCAAPTRCPAVPENVGQPCNGDVVCRYGVCGVESNIETSCIANKVVWRKPQCDKL